jgi:hypothetical protein
MADRVDYDEEAKKIFAWLNLQPKGTSRYNSLGKYGHDRGNRKAEVAIQTLLTGVVFYSVSYLSRSCLGT